MVSIHGSVTDTTQYQSMAQSLIDLTTWYQSMAQSLIDLTTRYQSMAQSLIQHGINPWLSH